MVFKRYIKKHGKKLGPYYYHNIRGNDGKIKTIYVGTNPANHQTHRIRKPLFFLILVLILILALGGSLFFLQNKAVLLKQSQKSEPNFDVDQILLKVLVKSGDYLQKQIRVMNTGNNPASINVELPSISDIVSADSTYFTLKPGQTKVVTLNFSSIAPNQNIEQQAGIYVGKLILKSEKAARDIPVVVEIETKDVLFDMNLNPVAIERRVKQGEDTTIEVKVFNLESIESVNVDVEYFVKDMNGNTIVTESETVVVKTQASFFKTISIPKNLKPGPYVFAAQAKFGKSVGTASYMFEVTGPEAQHENFVTFCESSILCLGLSMTTILLIIALIAYFYFYVGVYLYEWLTGTRTIRKKKVDKEEEPAVQEVPIEKPKENIFSTISGKLKRWQRQRKQEKLKGKGVERESEIQNLEQEKFIQLEARKRQKESQEKRELEEQRREKLAEEKNRINKEIEEKRRIEQEQKKQRELEAKRKEEEEKAKRLQEEKRKKEENLRRLEEERKQEELRKKKEIERKKDEEEKKKRELLWQKQKELEQKRAEQEKLSRGEEERRQKEIAEKRKEIEIQKREEEKRQHDLEEKQRKEDDARKKEQEKIKEEEVRRQKLELIRELEEKLERNKESIQNLNAELENLEAEKRVMLYKFSEIDSQVNDIEKEIEIKSIHLDKIHHQKNALIQNHQLGLEELAKKQRELERQKSENRKKIKEKLAEQEAKLLKEMDHELGKFSPTEKPSAEKWKKIEIKAKLKLEEHRLYDQLKSAKNISENTAEEEGFKKTLVQVNENEHNLKKVDCGNGHSITICIGCWRIKIGCDHSPRGTKVPVNF